MSTNITYNQSGAGGLIESSVLCKDLHPKLRGLASPIGFLTLPAPFNKGRAQSDCPYTSQPLASDQINNRLTSSCVVGTKTKSKTRKKRHVRQRTLKKKR